jgi:acyl carrier protein
MDAIPFVQPADSACRFISIQWGAWALGQQVSDIVMESMQRNGFLHITGQLGMEALEKLILSNKKSIAFVPGSMDARQIASNINSLRQGLNANMNSLQQDKKAKPERSHAAKPAQEETTMSSVMKETPTAVTGSGNIQLLTSEFEKQRAMLLQLFESQNALLSGAMGNASLQIPAVERVQPITTVITPPPPQAVQLETPVEVYQPEIPEVAPTPSMAPASTPPAMTPEPEQISRAAVEAPAPSTDTDKPLDLYDYVRSMMAKAVEMHETDIDPDQNFMELGADSMTAMSMVKDMETRYGIELPATLLFEYTTLNELVEFLKNEIGDTSVSNG